MRNRRFKEEGAHSYWQSVTDALTGLVLILLLILMLFMVRILYFSNNTPDGTSEYNGQGDYRYEDGYDYRRVDAGGDGMYPDRAEHTGGGAANGGGTHEEVRATPEPSPTPSPVPSTEQIGETGYAAVLVQVVDTDSNNRIEESGVRFEIYDENRTALELKTYYPTEIAYRHFDTQGNGTFFIPEKLPLGAYTLRNISNATGYNIASEVAFTVDKDHNWEEPLIVTVYVGPEKNTISIQLVDTQGNRVNLPGEFAVYANTDIVTADGTMRYSANEWVDTIVCDEKGTGTSAELYLGEYRIETHFEHDFFVGTENVVTLYSRNTESGRTAQNVVCEKTRIAVQLVDELQSTLPLAGGEYELRDVSSNEVKRAVTDSAGRLEFSDLEKDGTYELRQLSAPSRYYEDSACYTLYVDHSGYIEGQACFTLTQTNRTIRVELSLIDAWLRKPIEGYDVNLYDSEGKLVLSYRAAGDKKQIDGLEYGSYWLEIGEIGTVCSLEIKNTAERQYFTVPVRIQSSIYLICGIAGTVMVCGVAGSALLWKRKRKEKQ